VGTTLGDAHIVQAGTPVNGIYTRINNAFVEQGVQYTVVYLTSPRGSALDATHVVTFPN